MQIRELLTLNEGRKNKVYRCTAGKRTIGVGHNIDAKGLPEDIQNYLNKNGEITDEMIDRLLDNDIEDALTNTLKIFPMLNTFSEDRQSALIDFVFNVGLGTARQFHMTILAIQKGDWKEAARQMEDSLWFKQVADRGQRIVSMIRSG